MMKHLRAILCCGLLLLGAALPLSAQFFTLGADPGGVRWSSIETPTYRLVYPRGARDGADRCRTGPHGGIPGILLE